MPLLKDFTPTPNNLSELSIDELKNLRATWVQEAHKADIFNDTQFIARTLGRQQYNETVCTHNELTIIYHRPTAITNINNNQTGQPLLHLGLNDPFFLPGPWLTTFNQLLNKAASHYTEKQRDKENARHAELVKSLTYINQTTKE